MSTGTNWGAWTQDVTISATQNDGASDQTAEYTNDAKMMTQMSVRGTYNAGTYDGPALFRIRRRTRLAATYQDSVNAHKTITLNGGSGQSFNQVVTIGPDVEAFIGEIENNSNLNITSFEVYVNQTDILTT